MNGEIVFFYNTMLCISAANYTRKTSDMESLAGGVLLEKKNPNRLQLFDTFFGSDILTIDFPGSLSTGTCNDLMITDVTRRCGVYEEERKKRLRKISTEEQKR